MTQPHPRVIWCSRGRGCLAAIRRGWQGSLSGVQSAGSVAAADIGIEGLEGLEVADEANTFLGNRCRAGAGELEQFAARVCPTTRQVDAAPVRLGVTRWLYMA